LAVEVYQACNNPDPPADSGSSGPGPETRHLLSQRINTVLGRLLKENSNPLIQLKIEQLARRMLQTLHA
jgi:hypothetical protein